MKKIFTIDDFIAGVIAALGYGLSFDIPRILGYEQWQCLLSCCIVGFAFDRIANKIVFSKAVQTDALNKCLVFVAFMSIFFAIQYVVVSSTELSMYEYLLGQYAYLIVVSMLGFAFSMMVRRYRIKKIQESYGDGSKGFVFDYLLKRNDVLEELNRQNQPIKGAFDAALAVKTKNGVFVGEKMNDSIFFCGIPYAQPPVGERRWKAPEPLPESEDVFEAKYLGASAIQVDYDGSVLKHYRQSEDCLTLNICVGAKKTYEKKSVIVIFHHGDFSYGGSADPILYGENFTKIYPDAVAVSFNYRLGIFGFIDFSEVPGGEEYPDALNLGLLDQIAALRWIKENISAFGGNPERITVMGFESGALSVSLLAASAQAKGLFQRAFIFDGSPIASYATPEVSRELAKKLLQTTSTTTMKELLRLSTQQLKEASQKLASDLSVPTRDDKLIPVDVYAAYRNGSASGIEFIIGIAANERQIYKSSVGNDKYDAVISKEYNGILNYLDAVHPDGAKAVRAYVEEQSATMPALEAKARVFEQCYVLSLYRCAQKLSESGNKVRLLYWNVKPLIEKLGSGTLDVAAAFLGNREAAQMYGNVQNRNIAEILQNLFRKFNNGDKMRLFNNEIKGIDAIDWKEFPLALVVSEEMFKCEPVADKLTEIKVTEIKGLAELINQ